MTRSRAVEHAQLRLFVKDHEGVELLDVRLLDVLHLGGELCVLLVHRRVHDDGRWADAAQVQELAGFLAGSDQHEVRRHAGDRLDHVARDVLLAVILDHDLRDTRRSEASHIAT